MGGFGVDWLKDLLRGVGRGGGFVGWLGKGYFHFSRGAGGLEVEWLKELSN